MKSTPKLKLGPIPDDKPVRLTITLSAELAALLCSYANAVGVRLSCLARNGL
jgi:hypothetical protein